MLKNQAPGTTSGIFASFHQGAMKGDNKGLGTSANPQYDPDAWKYIQYLESRMGGGVTTVAPLPLNWKRAINTFVVKLKAMGAWDNADLIYPFIGGTAACHSVNLKNPGGGNEIVWHGTVTHDYRGPRGDGSTGYGDTLFVMNGSVLKKYQQNSASLAVYLTANNGEAYGGAPFSIGGLSSFTTQIGALRHQSPLQVEPFINSNSGTLFSGGKLGFTMGIRNPAPLGGTIETDMNNGLYVPNLTGSTTPNGFSCLILSANFGGSGPYLFTRFSMGFAFVGGANINTMEMYNAVEQLQIALGRSVF